MKRDGQLVIAVNTEQTMAEFYRLFEQVLLEQGLAESAAKIQEQILAKRLSRKRLEAVLHTCGFEVCRVIEDRFSIRFADGTTLFGHYLIQNFFLDGWKSLVPTERQSSVFARIEGRLNRMSRQTGHISLTIPYLILDAVPAS